MRPTSLAAAKKMRYQPLVMTAFPSANGNDIGDLPTRALVADIGGTNARFAVADLDTLELTNIRRFRCEDQPDIGTAAFEYVRSLKERPRYAAIAVAAPVVGDEVKLTNSPWRFVKSELAAAASVDGLLVLNDFQALALSLPYLQGDDLHRIGGGKTPRLATRAVLGPGTGLGIAGLLWGGMDWIALAGEGGHASLSVQSPEEFELAERLRAGRGRVSVERALSGPGVAELYLAVAEARGRSVEPLVPNDVLERALDETDNVAVDAVQIFITWLGRFAGDVALLFGARGGIYLGGGIAPKIRDILSAGVFRSAFEDKGRMRGYLAPIPVFVIAAPAAALKGAAAGLRSGLARGGGALVTPSF
jgi:glucokinase